MTRLTVDIPNNALVEQILTFLHKFEEAGVKVQQSDMNIDVLKSIKTAAKQLKEVKNGTEPAQLAEEFLDEL